LVLHDFYRFLSPDGNPGQLESLTIRALKNIVEKCRGERKCIILTGARYFLPIEFDKLVLLIDWPLPEKELIEDKLKLLLKSAEKKPELKFKCDYTEEELEFIIKAFQGLSIIEIEMICTYLMLTDKEFNSKAISSKKQSIIKKTGILEWIEIEYGLSEVGGLANLKNWLIKRKIAFSEKAVQYGLPETPKGLLIIGVQGAGKSRISKAIASYWGLPLLRLDVGRIFSGIVGSSEENLRSVIKTAESVAPCIMWCDEIDKAFSNTSFSSDSGTSSRVFGTFLTWMQEKKSPVFVVATANDVSKLPPELIRKGRFDDIFFVDLPDANERQEIWKIHLLQRHFNIKDFNLDQLTKESENFTGAEIEAAIVAAMYEGFSDNERAINTVDILKELKESVPINTTMKEEINALRTWASTRARNASKYINKIPAQIKEDVKETIWSETIGDEEL
jgi:SpoVK/Ycf46/Vps4 family AAA+-type ATPase